MTSRRGLHDSISRTQAHAQKGKSEEGGGRDEQPIPAHDVFLTQSHDVFVFPTSYQPASVQLRNVSEEAQMARVMRTELQSELARLQQVRVWRGEGACVRLCMYMSLCFCDFQRFMCLV